MIRTIAFFTAVICALPLSASAGSLPRSVAASTGSSDARCLQAFQQSAAAATCSANVSAGNEPGTCAVQASCRNSRGSISKSSTKASYPEGVEKLVNCNGNLRQRRC
ncbi:hypothetical protein GCM10009552_25940 [Rothia nasimurium]|uniref:Uncharacterized protein n=1 Tax=Luteibacter anthropi TaxID=564369 RepID=A0A7X5U783_9GAMM|nr:hypothetical protein [Luteibacter anthropi]NII05033.1 hypothetical protein [Luteibacter anthropi]